MVRFHMQIASRLFRCFFVNVRKRRATDRRKRGNSKLNLTQLGVEVLEERRVLSAAVGSFARVSGYVSATSDVQSGVGTIFEQRFDAPLNQEVLIHSSATAQVMVDGGFAFSHNENTALVPTPIGSSIAVPQATTAGSYQIVISDTGKATIPSYSESKAIAGYSYNADPEFGSDLTLFEHLFLANYGGEIEIEPGEIQSADGLLSASFGDFYAFAQMSDGSWYWESGYNGIPLVQGFTEGPELNLHFVGQRAMADGTVFGIDAQQEANYLAESWDDGFVDLIWNTSVAAWGYVTSDGQDVTPGDFDYDGDVDEDDYGIWNDGSPQADADLDGDVDADDYAVWAANVGGIVVSTLTDESDGNYSAGDLSLREALLLAADGNHPGSDIIAFDESLLGGTITLNPSLGGLNIYNTSEVKILGPGADQLTIDANGGSSMFFVATGGASSLESTLSNLKLTGTSTSGTAVNRGAGENHDLVLDKLEIVNNGWGVRPGGNSDTRISNSIISNNYQDGIARTSKSDNPTSGRLTIINSKIIDNGKYGIFIRSLDTDIIATEIAGNNTLAVAGVEGIFYESEDTFTTLTITDSTIAENDGPGISIGTDADANIRNTTISSNAGVGMSVADATAILTNVTVTQNRVSNSTETAGLYADSGSTIELHNTIVAQNYAGPSGSEVLADLGQAATGSFSIGTSSYNMIGVVGDSGFTASQNNIILGSSGDPGLTALGNYGGPTRTHALLSTSQAIDAGDNAKALALDLIYDQRGEDFDRIVDWDQDLDARVDIGAFELAISELFS